MAFPDVFSELARLSIQRQSGTAIEFATITKNISIKLSERGGEGIPVLNGGRLWKQDPAGDPEITIEHFPIELDVGTAGTAAGLFQQYLYTGAAAYDTAEPLGTPTAATTARERDRFRVCVLWTNDSTNSTGAGATAASTDSIRYVLSNARLVSMDLNFGDDPLTATATFKAAAYKKDGTPNEYGESGDQTALVAISTTLGSFT